MRGKTLTPGAELLLIFVGSTVLVALVILILEFLTKVGE